MRRRTLFLATAATTLAAAGPAARAGTARFPATLEPRKLRLRHAASGSVFSGTYHNGLMADAAAMAELSRVLADSHTGEVRPFDPDAIEIVWEMGRRLQIQEFVVLSGYRTIATNRAVHGAGDSQHLRAAALDLHIPAAKFQQFGDTARKLARGGVGLYPDQGFIHLDSGPVRHWGGDAVQAGAMPSAPRRSPAEQRIDKLAEAWASLSKR